ncbi:MAG: hypothetical protein U1F43_12630 [Myxococcota bacterium]
MRALPLAALVLSCLSAAPALAAGPPSPAAALGFDASRANIPLGTFGVLALPGELQLVVGHVGAIALGVVDPDVPGTLPAEDSVWLRARLSPALILVTPDAGPFALYRLAGEIDVLRNWLAVGSDRDALAADPRGRVDEGLVGQRLSQLYLQAAGAHVAVQLGLVRSRWGLGIVSNAGDDVAPGDASSPFGVPLQGDHVVRAGVSFFPLTPPPPGDPTGAPLQASLAVDGVIDDDTASWSAGDRAYQMVAAVSGKLGVFRGGVYFAHRWQTDAGGGDTTVTVLDATVRLMLAEEADLRAFLEGEVATIRGSSSLAQSLSHQGSFDVDQLGGVARFGAHAGPFLGVLEVGVASGDDNPFDDELRGFSFDRDYRVGLLLFHEVLRADAAGSAYNVADPTYRGEPPRGYRRLATLGAVRGASYANPRVDFGLLDGDLHLMAGFLYAASDGEYVDPFWSGIAGGAPRGPRNGAPSRDLGWEVDLGASLAVDAAPLQLRFRLEAAYCRPGSVFSDSAGRAPDEVLGAWAHVGVLW